jgi:hypothetical protein
VVKVVALLDAAVVPDVVGLERAVVYEPIEPGELGYVGILWADRRPDIPHWLVEERVQWDQRPSPEAGVVRIGLLRRHPSLSHDDFVTHWTGEHALLARAHYPSAWSYVQNAVVDGNSAVDGIAEMGAPTTGDLIVPTPMPDVRSFLDVDAGQRALCRVALSYGASYG